MGLNVYYPSDVCNALLAAEQARLLRSGQARLLRSGQAVNAATDAAGDQDDPFTAGFLAGYRAALTTIALAFGLPPPRQAGLPTAHQPSSTRRVALNALPFARSEP